MLNRVLSWNISLEKDAASIIQSSKNLLYLNNTSTNKHHMGG